MRLRFLSLMFVFASLVLFSRSVYAASFCVTSEVAGAVARAEAIFSGKITKVEPVDDRSAAGREYLVTFKVDSWWKGKPAAEMRVMWRPTVLDCPYLPVGEVGEDYLVYADPSISTSKDQSLEVTIFNRTSRLPANQKFADIEINWGEKPRISPQPELNRADASNDVDLLRVLQTCDCLPSTRFALLEPETSSECKTCSRWRLKPF